MTAFDVTDKAYQKSEKYAPDKTSSWPYPKEKDGWTLAHNSLRDEMRGMVEALQAVKKRGPLKEWEVKCIQSAWNAHYEHIHAHHTNEDVLLAPFLGERFHVPDKIASEHKELEGFLERMGKMVSSIKEGAEISDEMMEEFTKYETEMKPHLQEEEDVALPLTRAYFTPKELAPKIQEIIGHGPKVEMGSFIDSCGVEKFRTEFMKQEGIPGFVWYIDFKARHKLFLKEFKNPINALKSGEEPVEVSMIASIKAYLFGK